MNDKVYPTPVPPRNPAFEELWMDRCAPLESDLFEDISLDPQEVVSALTKDDRTALCDAKRSRRKRIILYGTLVLALLLGLVATIVALLGPFHQKANPFAGGNIRGKKLGHVERPSEDIPDESTTSSPTSVPPMTSGSTASPEEELFVTETSSTTPGEITSTPSSSTLNTEEISTEQNIMCLPNITLRQNLLSEIDECEGCSSNVVLDGNTTVVRYDDNIYFYSNNDGDESYWKKSGTMFRGTSSDVGLALSGNITVLTDFTTDDLNRDVFAIENGLDDKVRRLSLDPEAYDEVGFGHSIDIDGEWMVVGAPGAAYLYQFIDNDWYLYTVLTDENNDSDDDDFADFAEQVAVWDGKVAVTGFNAKGQVAVFLYEKNPSNYDYEQMEEIVIDHCDDDDCDGVGLSLAFTDDGGLMVAYHRQNAIYGYGDVYPRQNAMYYFVRSEGYYELEQEIDLPAGYSYDNVVVSGSIAVAKSSNTFSSLDIYVKTSSGVWTLATTQEYSENVSAISLSGRNLMVSVGHQVLWYTLGLCEQ